MSNIAIIDIGSNSVRLVIYDGTGRSPFPIYNEKHLCGLADGLEHSRQLHPLGVEEAKQTLCRFITLSKHITKKCFIFATSAVRDATDGQAFVEHIEQTYRVKISVLSGEEEAKYAGLGVISSIEHAHGIVGDLGGGSLELIPISQQSTGVGTSYPIGPLRFSESDLNLKDYQKVIDSHFKHLAFSQTPTDNFYAIGGAFRALAKTHMQRKFYPLKAIHQYGVRADDMLSTLHILTRMSEAALHKLTSVPKKRAKYIPLAALLMERYIHYIKPKHIIFSTHGVREGYLFDQLTPAQKRKNPLIEGAITLAKPPPSDVDYAKALYNWIMPICKSKLQIPDILIEAACYLANIGRYENPEYRADISYQKILDASLVGLTHKHRLILAKTLFYRYSKSPNSEVWDSMLPLLSSEELDGAQVLGSLMRLAKTLCAGSADLLKITSLKINPENQSLVLGLKKKGHMLNGESVDKKLRHIATLLECESYAILPE